MNSVSYCFFSANLGYSLKIKLSLIRPISIHQRLYSIKLNLFSDLLKALHVFLFYLYL